MGQLQQLVLNLVVVFLVMTSAFTWYSVAAVNGGYDTADIPLSNSVDRYYNDTYTFQKDLLNSSKAATQSPSTADPATGLSTLTAAGAQTVTLTINSIGSMADIISTSRATLSGYGIQDYFFDYALMFVSVLMGMIVFAAIYKWWI
jgi:hypothetical protein